MKISHCLRPQVWVCLALLLNGYEKLYPKGTNPTDPNSANTPSFPRAITGFDYPLQEPLPEETNGILLRLKPVDHTLNYEMKMVVNFQRQANMTGSSFKPEQITTTTRRLMKITLGSKDGTLMVENTSEMIDQVINTSDQDVLGKNLLKSNKAAKKIIKESKPQLRSHESDTRGQGQFSEDVEGNWQCTTSFRTSASNGGWI